MKIYRGIATANSRAGSMATATGVPSLHRMIMTLNLHNASGSIPKTTLCAISCRAGRGLLHEAQTIQRAPVLLLLW